MKLTQIISKETSPFQELVFQHICTTSKQCSNINGPHHVGPKINLLCAALGQHLILSI